MPSQSFGLTGISKKGASGLRPAITNKDEYRSLQYKLFKTWYRCLFVYEEFTESDWHLFCVVENQKYLILLKLVLQR